MHLALRRWPQIAQGIDAPEHFELNSSSLAIFHVDSISFSVLSSATMVHFHVHQKLGTFGER